MKHSVKIPEILLSKYMDIGNHLRHKNRFGLPDELEIIVKDFISYHISNNIQSVDIGKTYYRSRILEVGRNEAYPCSEMGVPPAYKTRSGRLNPEGISYLYLAEKPETAVAELRPWKGAQVSVGRFITDRNLEIVSIEGEYSLSDSAMKEAALFFNSAALYFMYFSAPAHQEDSLAYLPTQYIAEAFKRMNIDGLRYKSVLHECGFNVVLFDPASASCRESKKLNVRSVTYETDTF